jgi:DNA-binding transcriptional ArsR family regulator
MTYEHVLTALSDPTRRAILDRLRPGPLSVAEIAEPLPVSRPAVSQHLKLMKTAGLLTVERIGTRNLYALAPSGLDAMRAWLDGLWDDALASFARGTQARALERDTLPPVTKSLHVRLSPAEAFALFTEDIALWWPVSTHSVSSANDGALPQALVFQTREGGQVIETLTDGSISLWGQVIQWSPPRVVQIAWHVGRPADHATTLEIRFDTAGRGTKVTLIHDGWEAVGTDAAEQRATYDEGWDHVFATRYSAAAAAALSNF